MKTVLIVDDEKTFRSMLAEGLKYYKFTPLLAADGEEAQTMLQTHTVDIVVTDLKMPRADGFTLLAYMSKYRPHIPVIVMTAHGTQDVKNRLDAYDIFTCMDKPIDFPHFVQTVQKGIEAGAEGTIRGIPLPAFLQLVEMERKTCTLTIRTENREGRLYFFHGNLLDAECGDMRGEDAAYEIVCWDGPEIEIERSCRKTKKIILEDLHTILMDAFRLMDEQSSAGCEPAGTNQTMIGIEDPRSSENVKSHHGNTKEDVMSGTKEVLDIFVNIDGVVAACFVGRDGFLLESSARTNIDPEMVAAIAATGFGAAESMGRQLGKGGLSMCLMEYESGPVMICPAGSDGAAVIVAEKNANVGMIRLQLKRQVSVLESTLVAV